MKEEFPEVFDEFLYGVDQWFKKIYKRKREAIKQCQKFFQQNYFDAQKSRVNKAMTFAPQKTVLSNTTAQGAILPGAMNLEELQDSSFSSSADSIIENIEEMQQQETHINEKDRPFFEQFKDRLGRIVRK